MRRKNLFAVLALVLTLALVIPAVVAVPADAATTKKAVKLNKTKASIYQGKTLQLKVKVLEYHAVPYRHIGIQTGQHLTCEGGFNPACLLK